MNKTAWVILGVGVAVVGGIIIYGKFKAPSTTKQGMAGAATKANANKRMATKEEALEALDGLKSRDEWNLNPAQMMEYVKLYTSTVNNQKHLQIVEALKKSESKWSSEDKYAMAYFIEKVIKPIKQIPKGHRSNGIPVEVKV